MRVLACLVYEHDFRLVMLAALMCVLGSAVTIQLFGRTLNERGVARYLWCFLSAVTAGAAIWATHFIAMLGYDPGVPVTFDGTLTIVSALLAVAGTGLGILIATTRNRLFAALCGGGTFGLAIAAMHYVGMFAYRVDGVVSWDPAYVIASTLLAVAFSAFAIDVLRSREGPHGQAIATALLVLAIVLLHFTGMAAFSVVPIEGVQVGVDTEAFSAMATAIAAVALLIVGTGISTHLVEHRTRSDSQDRLQYIAMHDALTRLANRHSYEGAIERLCADIDKREPFALLVADLDGFKPVNDTMGHSVGDEVLRRVARRLRCAVRPDDIVARIGGDEFAIIAHGIAEERDAEALAERMVEILNRPFAIGGNVAEISGSVGIALAPRHGPDAETLKQNADVALYAAKRDGKRRHRVFDRSQGEAIERRRFLETDLRRACMREDFQVVYQPIIDTKTGQYKGAEALIRWHCATRGEIPPSEFVPIAEELGLITRIGAGVLHRACLDASSWPDHLDVAVNLSPVQLLDPRLPQIVQEALDESGLAAHRLELEITETALLGNDELALRTLSKLRDLGIRISLDDFGTGYSSLSYLHRFPISRIKIDRSFVQRLPDDLSSVSIVRAIAQLGSSLGMQITAEGIETDEQLSFISRHGCDHVQGFLLSKPVRAQDVAELFGGSRGRAVA